MSLHTLVGCVEPASPRAIKPGFTLLWKEGRRLFHTFTLSLSFGRSHTKRGIVGVPSPVINSPAAGKKKVSETGAGQKVSCTMIEECNFTPFVSQTPFLSDRDRVVTKEFLI